MQTFGVRALSQSRLSFRQRSPFTPAPSLMLRHLLPAVAILLLTEALPIRLTAQTTRPSPKTLHAALGGTWTGTLRYRDYQDSTRFVSLPTVVEGTTATDSTSVRLNFVYDDGPGKTVRSSDSFALNAEASALLWGPADGKRAPSSFVVQQLSGDTTLTLVVEMIGEDDNRKARIRETLTVDANELHILKDVQFRADAPWVFRHEYRFRRRADAGDLLTAAVALGDVVSGTLPHKDGVTGPRPISPALFHKHAAPRVCGAAVSPETGEQHARAFVPLLHVRTRIAGRRGAAVSGSRRVG